MKDRIKKIREDAGLNQSKFGERISISRSAVWKIENGENTPSEQTISLICKEFNVNDRWIREGIEPMYQPSEDKLSYYLGQIKGGNDDFIKDLVEVYMELDQNSKEALKKIATSMAKKISEREQT